MLTNIRRSSRTLQALTNGGHQDANMIGDFPNLGGWGGYGVLSDHKLVRRANDIAVVAALLTDCS
jgi:hypothetical protein